jgi:DNA-directed RNA polymerase subunit RPC12/RpoP
MIEAYECTQCGSTEFDEIGNYRVRCSFCGSQFEILHQEPHIKIKKGAHVTFGEHANVEIRGDMEIDSGADVDIRGKVTFLKGKEKQGFALKLIQEKKHTA